MQTKYKPINKVQCFGRQSIFLLDFGFAIHSDQVECFETGLVQIRWFSVDHLDKQYAQAPDVDFVAIFLNEKKSEVKSVKLKK